MNTMSSIPLPKQQFVGRDEYLKEFKAFLHGDRDYRVLFLHGHGGIGKTWLLRKMLVEARKKKDHKNIRPDLLVVKDLIDMYSTSAHTIEGLRRQLISLLGKSAFQNYLKSQKELMKAEEEGFREETLSSMRQRLNKDFLEDCRNLSRHRTVVVFFDTFELVQRVAVGGWLLTEMVRELSDFRFVVASRDAWGGNTYVHCVEVKGFSIEDEKEYFRVREKSEADPKFLDAIRKQAKGHPMRMELALQFLKEKWVQEPDRLYGLKDAEFEKALVAPLLEMGQGLFGRREFDEAVNQTIRLMAFFNRRINADFLESFIKQGAVDLYGFQPQEFLNRLEQEFFFVKTRPDGYIQLHDEMERLINQHVWPDIDHEGELRKEWTHIACQWYAGQIGQAGAPLDDLKAEQMIYLLNAGLLEEAYRLLRTYDYSSFALNTLLVTEVTPNKVEIFPSGFAYCFATDLGERAQRVYLYERGQEYWRIAVNDALRVDDPDKSLDAFLGLHNCTYPVNLDKSLEILLKHAEPLCTRNEKKRAQVLYEIGFTYSRRQQYLNAIEYYKRAKDVAGNVEMMATILNDMGYVYVFWGDNKRAARYVRQALELRKERVERLERALAEKNSVTKGSGVSLDLQRDQKKLENDLANAWWYLGLSFNTLGNIKRFDGDLAASTGYYSEALEIFRREDVQDFSWQARALHSRGEGHRRLAMLLFGQGRLGACTKFEERAKSDFQRCLDLCAQYNIREKHTAYRRMGRLLHDQAFRTASNPDSLVNRLELLNEAKVLFEKGLQIARDEENKLEELENLTEIAFLVDDRLETQRQLGEMGLEDIQNAEQDIELLRDAVKKNEGNSQELFDFAVFKHLLELEEGAFQFLKEKYDDSLQYYINGYAGLASRQGYGVARYRQHYQHLLHQLRRLKELDCQEAIRWAKTIIEKWENTEVTLYDTSRHILAHLHPDLIEDMQTFLDTVFLAHE